MQTSWPISKYLFFKGAISLTIGIPIYLCITSNTQRPFGTWLDYAGIIIWLSGMYFETVADYQKNTFKSDPSVKIKYVIKDYGNIRGTQITLAKH